MQKKKINILGVTGSVGRSAVDVILAHAEKFEVNLISAHQKADELTEIASKLGAKHAVLTSKKDHQLHDYLQVPVDITLAAIVGMAGLESLMAAIPHSKAIAIANKEPLVAAGDLVLAACEKYGTKILPVDSEHNAIFQVFDQTQKDQIERIILTASGGPFREASRENMRNITPEQAVKHPNWSMGAKISIDSATMMNKALEVIEAHYLFGMPADKIDVLVHPQSIIHSMVEYSDGSVLAQLGAADMKTPITYALGWPNRMSSPGQKLDFKAISRLDFTAPDLERFPSIRLGYECLKAGQAACLVFNTANEIAVQAFLNHKIGFLDIVDNVEKALNEINPIELSDLESILEYDKNVRDFTNHTILNN